MDLLSLLGFTSLFYATVVPLLVLFLVGVLFIPCLLGAKGANPREIGSAITGTVLVTVGVVLVLSGLLTLAFSLISPLPVPTQAKLSLLLVALSGAAVLLGSTMVLRKVDAAAKAVPQAIVVTSFSLAGLLLTILGVLLLLLSVIASSGQDAGVLTPPSWWAAPILLTITGVLLALGSRCSASGKGKGLLHSLSLGRRP